MTSAHEEHLILHFYHHGKLLEQPLKYQHVLWRCNSIVRIILLNATLHVLSSTCCKVETVKIKEISVFFLFSLVIRHFVKTRPSN